MIDIRRVLIPTDFSAYSQHALKYAVALAQSFKAQLFVMHVWEHALVAGPTEAFPTEVLAEAENSEKEQLYRLTEEVKAKGIQAEAVFSSGRAYIEIVKKAGELDIDLITLATHGRTGLSHLVFGSTAEKIIRLAPCPVLTVKHPEHDFVK
ncbi:MAG: universal stress protein [Acidobacteriota bacterium]